MLHRLDKNLVTAECQHRNFTAACIHTKTGHLSHLGLDGRSSMVAALENQMPLPLEPSTFVWLPPTLGFSGSPSCVSKT